LNDSSELDLIVFSKRKEEKFLTVSEKEDRQSFICKWVW